LTVTTTCIGKAPSGTTEATKALVSGLNFNQAGSAPPLAVVTLIVALLPVAALFTWAGNGKLKPLPAVAISLGTETVMMPDDWTDASRTIATDIPPLPTLPAVTAPLSPLPELELLPRLLPGCCVAAIA
jgi:hypothetical protein